MTTRVGPAVIAALLVALPAAAADQPPLTLADAIRMARTHHPAVEAQRGQALAAGGRREQAGAALLPFVVGAFAYQPQTANLALTPSFARQILGNNGVDTVVDTSGQPVSVTCRTPGTGNCVALGQPPSSPALHNFWTAQLGLSWTVWDWGRAIYGYRSASDLATAAAVGMHTTERDVVLNVKVAFFGAIAAEEQVAVSEDAVKTYRAHLAQTQGFHDAGLRTGIDVATAESALASVAIALARARAGQEMARHQLLVAIGEDTWRDWRLVAEPQEFEVQPEDARRAQASPDALVEVALQQRTELVQLALQERALGSTVRSVRGAYLPQLTLFLGPTWSGPELGALVTNLTITFGVGYPIGGMSPFLVHGQKREAEANLLAVRAQARSTRDSIRQETADARALLASARDEVREAQALVAAASRQRALAEGRYQTGVGNVIELYDALLADVNARFQMVQARLDLAIARARLEHALGEGDR